MVLSVVVQGMLPAEFWFVKSFWLQSIPCPLAVFVGASCPSNLEIDLDYLCG